MLELQKLGWAVVIALSKDSAASSTTASFAATSFVAAHTCCSSPAGSIATESGSADSLPMRLFGPSLFSFLVKLFWLVEL